MKLGLYYIDFKKTIGEDFSEYEFNEQGIPLVRFHRSPEWQHNPVTVCQYALDQFNQFMHTNDNENKNRFLMQANWLMENHEQGPNNSVVWSYRITGSFYHLTPPWISGMAQGEALSVLLRAYELTHDQVYYQLAQKVWNIFSVSVSNGGIVANYPDGMPVIEEYPTSPISGVLNGFILSLLGIYDYWLMVQHQSILAFFNSCIESLKKNLVRYDKTYWSLYDLWQPSRLTSREYHRLHILLLQKLYHITKEELFIEISNRWNSYLKNPICNLKWMIKKIKERNEL